MAGRIADADIARVRERSPIADVIGERLALRSSGGGNLKGLCPFHDEKSPSFSVSPAKGVYYCFGCQEHGDVITFVQKSDALTFAEAVERLAARAGVELHYEQGGAAPRQQQGQRTRLVAAHAAAAEFYVEQLAGQEAVIARRFLDERGFDAAAAAQFGCGYAPDGWDHLVRHLRGRGFSDAELMTAGLAKEGRRGPIDRFRARLLWPIRDLTGDVIGFGARRLREDDTGPKYLNTPETPLYKKSQVLYGVDLAKKDIARKLQAVVVEGYTDVMACHLAGVPTAIATCGTAFGEEHIKVLRRLLMDQDEFRGEVIFTFDGDAAGQKAALRAFDDEQKFVTQTYVAVEPDGLDPCDLRLKKGDVAVRDLVSSRVPLFEFAIRSTLGRYDLETAEGRGAGRRSAMEVVRKIRDVSLRVDYARQLAGWLGLADPNELVAEARGDVGQARRRAAAPGPARPGPDPRDPALSVEREVLKVAVQRPAHAGPVFDALEDIAFTAPAYLAVRQAIAAAGGTAGEAVASRRPEAWVARLRETATDDQVRSLITELAVEPVRSTTDDDPRYAAVVLARLQELVATRRITELKSRLQRINPLEETDTYNRVFGDLLALEQHRRGLREQAIGSL